MPELIDRQAALEIAMSYCPDDDGCCSKAGRDIREMLDEIESLPNVHIDDMTLAEPELRNCPFCGFGSPTMRIYKGKDGWRDRYTVVCRYDEGGCGAEGGMYHSAAEAAEAWNRRADNESAEKRKH